MPTTRRSSIIDALASNTTASYFSSKTSSSLDSFSQISAKRQGWLFNPEGAQDAAFKAAINKSRETGHPQSGEYCDVHKSPSL